MKEAEKTRDKIIESAIQCFSRYGYDGTSVECICEVAGVSKGSFFYHFPTKQSLFLEILNGWLEEVDREIEELNKSNEDIPTKLLKMTSILVDIIATGEKEISLTFEFWNRALHDKDTLEKIISQFEQYRSYFSKLILEGIEMGDFKAPEPEIVSYTIVSFAVGLLIQRLFSSEERDWEKIAKEGSQIIIDGLKEG